MAKKRKTRKELLKSPDEFITLYTRAHNFVNAHFSATKYVGYAIGIIAIAYLGANWYLSSINRGAQDIYNDAYTILAENMKYDADTEALQKSEELFVKIREEYGMSKAAKLALPQIAYIKFAEKKYDEAIDLYREYLEKVSEDSSYASLTGLALAACYEAKGELKTAIEILNPILKKTDDPCREMAMLNLARLYRLDNEPEKAKKMLKEFDYEFDSSPFLPMVRAHLS